jgi:hypothetical protein
LSQDKSTNECVDVLLNEIAAGDGSDACGAGIGWHQDEISDNICFVLVDRSIPSQLNLSHIIYFII